MRGTPLEIQKLVVRTVASVSNVVQFQRLSIKDELARFLGYAGHDPKNRPIQEITDAEGFVGTREEHSEVNVSGAIRDVDLADTPGVSAYRHG